MIEVLNKKIKPKQTKYKAITIEAGHAP